MIAGPGGDYYCDANHVNDNWQVIAIFVLKCNIVHMGRCPEYDTRNADIIIVEIITFMIIIANNRCPEYDTWEGNRETVNVQLHTCDYVVTYCIFFCFLLQIPQVLGPYWEPNIAPVIVIVTLLL